MSDNIQQNELSKGGETTLSAATNALPLMQSTSLTFKARTEPEASKSISYPTPTRQPLESSHLWSDNNQSANLTIALVDTDQSLDEKCYNQLLIDANYLYKQQQNLEEALKKYEEAFSIHQDSKLCKRINKIKSQLDKKVTENRFDAMENDDHILETYNGLLREAKSLIDSEEFDLALDLFKEAYTIYPSTKLLDKISKLESCNRGPTSNEEDNPNTHVKIEVENLNPCEENADMLTNLLAKGKKFEENNNVEEAIDCYRECHQIKPSSSLASKLEELERRCNINNNEDQEQEGLNIELYNNLIIQGREFLNNGDLYEALKTYKEALNHNYSDKLVKRIEKIEQKLLLQSDGHGNEETDSNDEIKDYYRATIADAKDKEENCLFDEAIALYEEANELIPKESISLKITELEFMRDSKPNEDVKPSSTRPLENLISSKDKMKYNELIAKGKLAQKESKIEKALTYYKKALNIHKNDKLVQRINKLQKFLEEEDENEGWYTDLGDGFFLTNEVFEKLYQYQREGVKWMWELYRAEHGGILGDDMGLGKTIQTIVYIQALFVMEEISSVMLVMPLSLMNNWQEEFAKWAPEIRVELFHGTKSERERNVKRVIKKGGVLLTTYGIIEKNVDFLIGTSFMWDYLILDEGHKIKNPTKTSKAIRNVPCTHRLLISGTPIQNNLKELWALFDFVSRGKLLGTMTTFKINYISPIERGRQKDASKAEARLGTKLAENLRRLIDPYFLRRTKAEIKKKSEEASCGINNLGKKNELCVWLQLSDVQLSLYKAFLTLDTVRDAMNSTKSPLAALTVLKKICDHPRLAIKFEALRSVMDSQNLEMSAEEHNKLLSTMELPENPSSETIQAESCKLKFTLQLLEMLSSTGHRTLLFSTSLKILDYVQSMIAESGIRCLRIDGTINKPGDRQAIIDKFNSDEKYSVFLLTTQVGGVGLNLTSADRVIIYDPNWNPATDSQAVDRAYRIGQTKPVIVYRILTSGTIEEKIYRKQVFKDSITRQATGDSFDPIRYFTNQEISQLFLLGNTSNSETCGQLEELHGAARNHSDQIKSDVSEITSRMGAIGCSDHDLLFSHEEQVENTAEERQYVDQMVEQAKRNLALDTGSGSGQNRPHQSGGGYDPRTSAVPLGGGMRAPQEPTRGTSMWSNKQGDVESVTEDIDRINITESQYFPRTGDAQTDRPKPEVLVINSDDDDEDEATREVKKKLSLSDYKKRQMKIFDYVDSPGPQPSFRPESPVRPRRSIVKNVVTPRKSLCNPVGLIIDNHVQLSSPTRDGDDSDQEVMNDLENSRYDNLNRPPCLDDSEEEGDEGEDRNEEENEEEDRSENEEERGENDEYISAEDGEEEGEEERKEKRVQIDHLTHMVDTIKVTPQHGPEISELRKSETTVQVIAEDAKADKGPHEITDFTPAYSTPAYSTPAEVAPSVGAVERTPDMRKFLSSGDEGKEKKITKLEGGECTCGRAQISLDKGYRVTKCLCMCSDVEEDKYNKYLQRGLEHQKAGNAEKALKYYKASLQIRNDDLTVQKAYISLKKQLK